MSHALRCVHLGHIKRAESEYEVQRRRLLDSLGISTSVSSGEALSSSLKQAVEDCVTAIEAANPIPSAAARIQNKDTKAGLRRCGWRGLGNWQLKTTNGGGTGQGR